MAELSILAPLRVEASALARGARTARVHRTGMGPTKARRAAARLHDELPAGQPVAIAGVGGGLEGEMAPGDIIVASRVRTVDDAVRVELPGAELLASELAATGAPVHVGELVSADHVVTRHERAELEAEGAIGVDMESAWLVAGLRGWEARRPLAVVRVVLDAPGSELASPRLPANLAAARRRLAQVAPSLERWAAAAGPRAVLLAGPRSFCAGVDRAIEIVERALDRFDSPIYVRRQIVHNTHVVDQLASRGAVFVQEVDEVPPGSTLVLAAHGVAPGVRAAAEDRDLHVIDATCPLVAKVHVEARRFAERGHDIVLIGHADHEEVEGTLGEAPERIRIVASADDVDELEVDDPERVAFLTQTTLAVDDVDGIVIRLRERFPSVVGPRADDICYATQNRQEAIAAVAPDSDLVLVVGSPNSSNSQRLAEVAARHGCPAHLIDGPSELRLAWLEGATTIGITAGASAPESKVDEVVAAIGSLGPITVEERTVREETVSFALPTEVR